MSQLQANYLDTCDSSDSLWNQNESPWNPYDLAVLNGQKAVQAVQTMQAVNDLVLNAAVGLGSSSPREFEADATFHQGLNHQFFRLNEPAFSEQSILCLPPGGREDPRTDYGYPSVNTTNAMAGSEPYLRRSQSPRSKFRFHPYSRDSGRSCTVYSQTSHIYPRSDFDAEETTSTYSRSEGCPYHRLPEYAYENDSINPQLVSNPQSAQEYWSTHTPTNIKPSLTTFQTTTSTYYKQNAAYLSSDAGATTGGSSGEEIGAAVAQSVKKDPKKGALKKSNSKKGKKNSTKGSIKGVQKSSEGKADKGVKGRKLKDRLMCTHSPCSKIYSNASELRKHMQVKHIRPFKCTFSFAGCDQIFGSKNEWKRHVTSQHMYLSYWQCNLSLCRDRQAFFNRKDLFSQHLKRMHVPHTKKIEAFMTEAEKKEVHEHNQVECDRWIRDEIPAIQDNCFKIIRETPLESNCEICKARFSGPKSWETKMEHVGKHYESGDQPPPDGPFEDEGLIRWALEERLVMERDPYESSSNASESAYLDPFSELSSSVNEVLMENLCKYQFTKSNQFISKSAYSDQSSNRKPDNLPPSNRDLDSHADVSGCTTASPEQFDNLLFDGAFNGEAPGDLDTLILLSGGRVLIP